MLIACEDFLFAGGGVGLSVEADGERGDALGEEAAKRLAVADALADGRG